ncbi:MULTISPECIES: hypothetical protein [Mesonia]|uniref:Uncharacterized protein n=1 Tax=Mesonia oceanica TaxID=2687242 RepID=A0AC61Y6E1_9FLAO|nr:MULTISPECIES: hypothetical protein [Mesonia]MAN28670.1 hypothetical protein [Mesonia sp.]MAQ41351.1 hypothetical protein [Mesonia sp.]MBJ97450.1 hypothetical protein [Flavobacteriaceae bacterium]VVU98924.1 hypothetical protein FVB9532_00173 [Mesonia oceanica]|tara:strand:- start:4066 stop:5652 length:1587 start_codon:yes stop_codon:yes gene_type:complete
MKFKLFLLVMLCLNITLQAQISPIQVTKSKIEKDKKKDTELMFTADDGKGGFISARLYRAGLIKMPKGYYIEHYDASLNLVSEYEYKIDDSSIKSLFVKDGQLNLIEYKLNREANTNDYNLLTSSLSKLDFSGEGKKIFSVSRDDVKKPFFFSVGFIPISNLGQVDHDPTGEVYLSKNRNYIAFNFDIKDDKEETHLVKVYDNDFNLVFENQFKQEGVRDNLFHYNSITIDDSNGDAYFLGKLYESKRMKKKGKSNYVYKLYQLNASGSKELSFDTAENFVGSMELINDDNNLVCVGFYSEKNDFRYKGTVYYNIDKENFSIKASSFNPFTEQFMIDKYGEKRGKRKAGKGKELSNLTYRGTHIDNQGNVFFTAEEYYIVTHTNYKTGATSYTYYYNDIFACKINTKGKMEWARNINKRQVTKGNAIDYFSYLSTVKDDRIIILLNGSDKVKKMRDDRIRFDDKRIKKLSLYAIEILPTGEFNYEQVINNDESKVTYKVAEGVISDNYDAVILEGNKGKKKRVVKLTL